MVWRRWCPCFQRERKRDAKDDSDLRDPLLPSATSTDDVNDDTEELTQPGDASPQEQTPRGWAPSLAQGRPLESDASEDENDHASSEEDASNDSMPHDDWWSNIMHSDNDSDEDRSHNSQFEADWWANGIHFANDSDESIGDTASDHSVGGGFESMFGRMWDEGGGLTEDERRFLRASQEGNEETVDLLLTTQCVDVDVCETRGNRAGITALQMAASTGHENIVRRLIDAGADVNAASADGRTALANAAFRGSSAIVQLLLDASADRDARDDEGRNALHMAAIGNRPEIVRMLLATGVDVDAVDSEDGNTALHEAAAHNHVETLDILLSHEHINIEATNKMEQTPLLEACARSYWEAVERLCDAGANLHATMTNGKGCLHMVLISTLFGQCSEKTLQALRFLVRRGIEWDSLGDGIVEQTESNLDSVEALRVCVLLWVEEHKLGEPLMDLPIEIVKDGVEATRTYIRERKRSTEIAYRRKICVVGPSNWGKTSLVKSLTSNQPLLEHPDDRTIGIDHFFWNLEEPIPELDYLIKHHEVTFWDFAGHNEYQVAHALFFSARTLFVVCVDLYAFTIAFMQAELMFETKAQFDRRLNQFIESKIVRWIRVIFARQPDAEFVFVGTKADKISKQPQTPEIIDDLKRRLQSVMVIVEDMKRELTQPSTTASEEKSKRPITHLGDERIAERPQYPMEFTAVSCSRAENLEISKAPMKNVVFKSKRSFPMPELYSLVLAEVVAMRMEASEQSVDDRIKATFLDSGGLIAHLREQIELLQDDTTCRTILRALRDLGDVLWFDQVEDPWLKNTIIIDPLLLIDFVRQVITHKHTADLMPHATLQGLPFWISLTQASMLAMKRLLQHFYLVYPTEGNMAADSDLIVPMYWRSNTCAFWMFGGDRLRFVRGEHMEDVAQRVHWIFDFVNEFPWTLFDHLVVATYSPFFYRDVGPDWILYQKPGLYACRVVMDRDGVTDNPTLHLEALLAHEADVDDANLLWDTFIHVVTALEGPVFRLYPGLSISRYARNDREESLRLKTLASYPNGRRVRPRWMPPTRVWAAFVDVQPNP